MESKVTDSMLSLTPKSANIMYNVTVNGTQVYKVDGNTVNGNEILADVLKVDNRFYHILTGGKSFNVEVVRLDKTAKTMTLQVNGTKYEVSLRDKFDALMEQMGFGSGAGQKAADLKAPMPGLVIEVRVQPGDLVKKGDPVIVLEAMKMENVLKAPGDGKVKSIEVQKGVSVEKGLVLIKFE